MVLPAEASKAVSEASLDLPENSVLSATSSTKEIVENLIQTINSPRMESDSLSASAMAPMQLTVGTENGQH